jgi:hypothetical protein
MAVSRRFQFAPFEDLVVGGSEFPTLSHGGRHGFSVEGSSSNDEDLVVGQLD